MTYSHRLLETKLRAYRESFPCVVLVGARQVGKTTLLQHLFGASAKTFVFDPVQDQFGARHDPDLFLRNNPPPLILDDGSHVATLADDRLSLTATEYRLLRTLMLQPERVFSRAQLMEQLGEGKGTVSGRTIDVHVRSLRKKLGAFSSAIDTARGVGYRFVPPVSRSRVRG